MNSDSQNSQHLMLTAYLDGELGVDERALFETELNANEDLQGMLRELQALRSSFRKLPRFQLADSFADQILSRLDWNASTSSQTSPAGELSESSSPAPTNLPRESQLGSSANATKPRDPARVWAIGLVLALAGLLLLTMSIAPLLEIGSPSSDGTLANSNPQPDPLQPRTDSDPNVDQQPDASLTENQLATPNRSNDNAASTAAVNETSGFNQRTPEMRRSPLAMRSNNDKLRSGIVESSKLAIGQVLVIDFKTDQADNLQPLKNVLTAGGDESIRIQDDGIRPPLNPAWIQQNQDSAQAILVIATNDQMKRAVKRIQAKLNVSVQAISLAARSDQPVDIDHQQPHPAATAQVVPMVKLTNNAPTKNQVGEPTIDPEEAKRLDEWFGLADEPAGKTINRFLILVK